MKYLNKILFFFLFVFAGAALAQTTGSSPFPGIDFSTVTAVAALIMFGEELVDRFWNLDGWQAQIRTVFIGVILCELGSFFKLGMFTDPNVVGTYVWYISGALIGVYCAIAANIVFLLPVAKAILEGLKIRPKEKQ